MGNTGSAPSQSCAYRTENWSAGDSLVLKAMAIVLGDHLEPALSPACVHVVGHGGAKKAVRDVFQKLSPGSHVMKSDVKSYYAPLTICSCLTHF